MEAGILALLGAQTPIVNGTESKDSKDSGLLESRPFNHVMASASAKLDALGKELPSAKMIGEWVERIPNLFLSMVDETHQITRQTDALVTLERALDRNTLNDLLAQQPLLAPLPDSRLASEQFQLALQPTELGTQDFAENLWAFANQVGADMFAAEEQRTLTVMLTQATQADGSTQVFFVIQETVEQTVVLAHFDVSQQQALAQLADWDAMLEEMRLVGDQLDAADASLDAPLPLVSFTPVMTSPALQPWLRQQGIQSIQLVDLSATQPLSSAPSPAAMPADLSQLAPEEMADLDALIERITQGAAQRQLAANANEPDVDFRQMMMQFVASQARQFMPEQAQATPSQTALDAPDTVDPALQHQTTHAASHALGSAATQNTHSDVHSLQHRILQANPHLVNQQATPTEQVQVTIQQAFRAGMDRVQIQLDPADLGRVEIRMDLTQDGRAQLVVTADNKDTLDQLQRDARLLERALQEAGIDADAQNMEFSLNQGSQQEENEDGTNHASPVSDSESLAPAENPESLMDPLTNYYTLSVAQGLNIKV